MGGAAGTAAVVGAASGEAWSGMDVGRGGGSGRRGEERAAAGAEVGAVGGAQEGAGGGARGAVGATGGHGTARAVAAMAVPAAKGRPPGARTWPSPLACTLASPRQVRSLGRRSCHRGGAAAAPLRMPTDTRYHDRSLGLPDSRPLVHDVASGSRRIGPAAPHAVNGDPVLRTSV